VQRAADFYAGVFGWKVEPSPFVEGYLMAATGEGDGIDGAIMRRAYRTQPTIVWIDVDDVDQAVAAALESGGTQVTDVNVIPDQARVVYITDSEGNVVGLRQPV
jgi:predicted enzyme related to lactoylglutathione lyase